MRRTGLVWGGLIVALGALLAGCASDRALRCGGDLVPINPPASQAVATAPRSKLTERAPRGAGDRP